MSRLHHAAAAVVLGVLVVGSAGTARAQIAGMPLFTNPRVGTGIRVHADVGQPTDKGTSLGNATVVQAGLTLALGPVGLGANAGMTNNDFKTVTSGAHTANIGTQHKFTASALLQLRLMGGGLNPLSLSLFGGGSYDVSEYDFGSGFSSLPLAIQDSVKSANPKTLLIPAGIAVGLKVPVLGFSVWGAPRMNLTRVVNCPSGATCKTNSDFRWAAGVDLPILGILSIRGAYDSGKIAGQTVSYWGVGASIGLGGMR
jgi:hypothetical protein